MTLGGFEDRAVDGWTLPKTELLASPREGGCLNLVCFIVQLLEVLESTAHTIVVRICKTVALYIYCGSCCFGGLGLFFGSLARFACQACWK
jgi:hypothetical protein